MSRAVILPHFGDPFALYYWLSWYKRVWHKEIDKLHIVSSNVLEETLEPIKAMIDDATKASGKEIDLKWSIAPIQHGDAIRDALERVNEELVMLVEEDTVIFKAGELDACFKAIESGQYDLVGGNRGSCSDILTQKSKEKYGACPLPPTSRDNCYNFWPNFFFCRKDLLLSTDRNFNARTWTKGEKIEQLGIDVGDEIVVGDTFVWASIQLRALTTKIGHVEQYHGSPSDLDDYNSHINVFDGRAGWVHHGSLSGWKSLFDDKQQHIIGVDMNEIARRMQWYRTFIDFWVGKNPDTLVQLAEGYRKGIQRNIALYEIPESIIEKRQFIYQQTFGQKV